jgi:hypothetical protein
MRWVGHDAAYGKSVWFDGAGIGIAYSKVCILNHILKKRRLFFGWRLCPLGFKKRSGDAIWNGLVCGKFEKNRTVFASDFLFI